MKLSPKYWALHLIYLLVFYLFLLSNQLLLTYTQIKARLLFWRSSEPTLQAIQKHSPYLKKLPIHIAIILDSDNISFHNTADLVSWCIGADIHYITLYDMKGELKKRHKVLEQSIFLSNKMLFGKMANLIEIKWWRGGNGGDDSIKIPPIGYATKQHLKSQAPPPVLINKQEFCLYTTSYEDGKSRIVDAAKRIGKAVANKQIQARDINYQLVESNLRVFPSLSFPPASSIPDPDFMLNFDESGMVCGFMPWHLRLTEIMQVGPLRDFTMTRFIDSLYLYSAVERRYGF